MRVECVESVERAIGRKITMAESAGIEAKILQAQRRLAAKNPAAWRAMPREGRLREAAQAVARDVLQAAELKERRAALQVEAHARNVLPVEAAGERAFEVVMAKLSQTEVYVKGTQREMLRQTLDVIDHATKNDTGSMGQRGLRWIASLETPERTLAFVREVMGVESGDAGAKAAAKAWIESAEGWRRRFNAAGGDVRKLMGGYLPQPHHAARIREAGIATWVREVLPLLDRSRYVNENGRPMNDAEVGELLEQAWRTIASEGWNKVEPGQFRGEGVLADAGSHARVLHFATPEGYVQYLGRYGAGTTFQAISGHINWMARLIGVTEQLGPNPAATFRTMHDTAVQVAGKDRDRVARSWTTETAWRLVSGEVDRVENLSRAAFHQNIRNVEIIGKLQQATLSAVTDIPTYFATLGYNRLPMLQGMQTLIRSFGGDAKHFAEVAGLISESKVGDMMQFAEDRLGEAWSRGIANAQMKVILLTAWTDGIRRATGIAMMAGMARLRAVAWDDLNKYDRQRLTDKGWTAEEWAVVNRATPETWRTTQMLTPAAIARIDGVDKALKDRVISRLLGTLVDESEFGSVNPDLRSRVVLTGGLQKGTGVGEIYRHLMLFKGFPFAYMFRHFDRMLNGAMSPAGKLAYSSGLLFGMTLFGALAIQLKELAAGRDPRDMTGQQGDDPARAVKFWAAAMAQGGGLGILGDLFITAAGRQGQSMGTAALSSVAGPVIGSGFELVYDVGIENLKEAAQGKDTHAGAEAFRWLRGHLPLVNVFYAKLAIDMAALNQLQEFLSPGYLSRVRERAAREWGSTFWAPPTGDGPDAPERAPDFARAFGQ